MKVTLVIEIYAYFCVKINPPIVSLYAIFPLIKVRTYAFYLKRGIALCTNTNYSTTILLVSFSDFSFLGNSIFKTPLSNFALIKSLFTLFK